MRLAARENERLKTALAEIHRRWGSEALRPLAALTSPAARIPTGYPSLDKLIGGGIPCGRMTELAGVPTSGMTTLAMKIIAQGQAQGRIGILVDTAGVFDPGYGVRCGVQLDGLLLARPANPASALDILQVVADEGGAALVVLDSLANALSMANAERALDAALRRLTPALRKSGGTVLALNPGQVSPALAHHAALRLAFENRGWLEEDRDISGCRARVTVMKSRGSRPDRHVDLDIALDGEIIGAAA